MISAVGLAARYCRGVTVYTTWPSWKMGRYMAMISPPISTPSTAMISGSSMLVRPSTILSTSSS